MEIPAEHGGQTGPESELAFEARLLDHPHAIVMAFYDGGLDAR